MPNLEGMTQLKEFSIFRARVGSGALAAVAGSKGMSKMRLRDSAITTEGVVEHIGKFQNLTSLELSESNVQDAALVEIGKLPKLEDLNLLRTRITDSGIKSIVGLKLKRLNLDDTSVGDAAIPYVAQIPTLEFLHLGKTAITDQGLAGLKSLTNLKDLILTDTGLSPSAVEQLQKALPKTKIKF
jgi:Leucine-rich repeat (LRR) protein